MNSAGYISITTSTDCVWDEDIDGIPGVTDADPVVYAPDACLEVEFGEVNQADASVANCHGTVAIVTGNAVTVDSATQYTAGEFISLLPGFSVLDGVEFSASTDVIGP